ncbi:uncharacterized protein LOC112494433 [Cephus cinctus]|uniref:Uncharacterized protein LOC112494433 n=1 Tax=Cephus cinctus TaxID=211228 RepID=A0AAJ7RJ01_CEPCN|nr:uncharacterized protein LOC112494433 [Cephus cinctus]
MAVLITTVQYYGYVDRFSLYFFSTRSRTKPAAKHLVVNVNDNVPPDKWHCSMEYGSQNDDHKQSSQYASSLTARKHYVPHLLEDVQRKTKRRPQTGTSHPGKSIDRADDKFLVTYVGE